MIQTARRSRAAKTVLAVVAILLAACAPGAGQPAGGTEGTTAAVLKRVTAAIQGDPHTLYQKMNPSSHIPGIENLEMLVNGGLARGDDAGILRPQLAEAVPSLENGLWKVLADGRMEVTWQLRPGTAWHDGLAFTPDDLIFTLRVARDRDLDVLADAAYDLLEGVEATDARTVVARWRSAYIKADTLFTPDLAMPIPKHVLEGTYQSDKAHFLELAFWTSEFVGTGPFKVRDFVRGSHMVFEANDSYIFGRPRLDQIEVRFIPDQNALIANMLADAAQLTMSRGLSVGQAAQIRDQWKEGHMAVQLTNWVAIWPQFVDPNPVVVLDPRFRRALLYAMNRQEMADVIQLGIVPVAHALFNPQDSVYKAVEGSIVKYDFDPRKAAETLEGMGFAKGVDGFYRDGAGQKLEIELRTSATRDVSNQAVLATGDYWQKAGVATNISITPPALARDENYRVTFPAFELAQNPNDVAILKSYGPDPTGAVTKGRNSYRNAEVDALIGRLLVTVSAEQRVPLLREIVHHMTDQVTVLGIFYGADPFLISNRLSHVGAGNQAARMAWNAHEWEIE